MLVIRDGASSVGRSRFLEQPEATVASAARATRGRVKRDMALSCGRTYQRRYRCWLRLGKRENLGAIPCRLWTVLWTLRNRPLVNRFESWKSQLQRPMFDSQT